MFTIHFVKAIHKTYSRLPCLKSQIRSSSTKLETKQNKPRELDVDTHLSFLNFILKFDPTKSLI